MNYKHFSTLFIALSGSFQSHLCPSSIEVSETGHCTPEKSVAPFATKPDPQGGIITCNMPSSTSQILSRSKWATSMELHWFTAAADLAFRFSKQIYRQVIPPSLNIYPAGLWLTLYHMDVLEPRGAQSCKALEVEALSTLQNCAKSGSTAQILSTSPCLPITNLRSKWFPTLFTYHTVKHHGTSSCVYSRNAMQ